MSSEMKAYHQQKGNARRRGISFEITFNGWCSWWFKELGKDWMKLRGCRRGQYVMARFNDQGSYVLDNVKCIRAEDNHVEYNKRRKPPHGWRRPNLPDEVVIAVYESDLPHSEIVEELGDEFGMTKHKIQCIKTKRYFKRITNELDSRMKSSR